MKGQQRNAKVMKMKVSKYNLQQSENDLKLLCLKTIPNFYEFD